MKKGMDLGKDDVPVPERSKKRKGKRGRGRRGRRSSRY